MSFAPNKLAPNHASSNDNQQVNFAKLAPFERDYQTLAEVFQSPLAIEKFPRPSSIIPFTAKLF